MTSSSIHPDARLSTRSASLAERLPEAGVDVMLISDLDNVRYLTGYTGSNGLAVVGPYTRSFITDFRYVEQAAQEVDPGFDRLRAHQELLAAIEETLPPGELRLGFEEAHLTVRSHRRLREQLPERVELVGVDSVVEQMRAVKGPAEVEKIRAAVELASDAFAELIEEGLVGRTEQELALALEVGMRRRGGQRVSFETIVAAGSHGALPHATPREREIQRGELVLIDWGVQLDGYCSDCTRTVAAGEPGPDVREVYGVVLEAQEAGLAALHAGAECREVDAAARQVIAAGGYAEQFGHNLGHGVGLAVHEEPRLSARSEERLKAGNVVTVEPGIYLPDRFGIRIEDLVVVGENGCQILTGISKELVFVD